MTVPGKGGRPRKWRSDADRVRAFRARQRGEGEPPTVEVARAGGDEAALAWDQVRELGVAIEALRVELKTSRTALRRAAKALEQERVRYRWISDDNDRLRADLEAAERDRVDLQARLDELARVPAKSASPSAGTAPGLSRASAGGAPATSLDVTRPLTSPHTHQPCEWSSAVARAAATKVGVGECVVIGTVRTWASPTHAPAYPPTPSRRSHTS
jgi:hypothetical protein